MDKIFKHIRGALTQNIGLKILALIAASLMWLVVVNVDDPTQSRNFTVTVKVVNDDVITEQGKYYDLPYGNTVTFRVTARRSVIEDMSSSDFTAQADMNYLEDDSRVPVEISANKHASRLSISSKTHYLNVRIGTESNSTFQIKAKTTGNPATGFEVGSIEVNPKTIELNGPTDIISKIESASVTIAVTDAAADINEVATPKFYDKNGEEVDVSSLELSSDTVSVTVHIESVQEVGLSVKTSGKLKKGLELSEITTNPERIRVAGDAEILNTLTTIEIPGSVVNLSQIKEDVDLTVDVTSYLPEGVSLANNQDSQVVVSVRLVMEQTKKFTVRTENLTIKNLSEGLEAEFEDKKISVNITGLKSALKELSSDAITGSVDVSGLGAGTHTVTVNLDLNDNLNAETVTATIVIAEVEEEQEEEEQ